MSKLIFITMIFISTAVMADSEQSLICTQTSSYGVLSPYDAKLILKVTYSPGAGHQVSLVGNKLNRCVMKIPNNASWTGDGQFAAINQVRDNRGDCVISDLTIKWNGDANRISDGSTIELSSYGYFVSHGAANYQCEEISFRKVPVQAKGCVRPLTL